MKLSEFLDSRYELIAKYYSSGKLNGDLVPEIDNTRLPRNLESPKPNHWLVEYPQYMKKLVQLIKSNPNRGEDDYYIVVKWHSINHGLQEYFRQSFEEYSLYMADVLRDIIDQTHWNMETMMKALIEFYVNNYSGLYRFTSSMLEQLSTPDGRQSIMRTSTQKRVLEILKIRKMRDFGPNIYDVNNLIAGFVWKGDEWLHGLQDGLCNFLIIVGRIYDFPVPWNKPPIIPIRAYTF
jgi:hypothetical protein